MANQMTALAFSQEVGKVGAKPVSNKIMIGYDDIYSIQYFTENLRPYWNNDGKKTIVDAFTSADKEYPALMAKCNALDAKIMTDAAKGRWSELC